MYAHNTAVPNRMIDIYSDSRMIAKEKKHPSRHFGKGVLITGAALVSAAALGVIGWCVPINERLAAARQRCGLSGKHRGGRREYFR